ncbi:hypothetical protein MicloDRAFT_00028930 [Microvirga lotononidis]|uniref:Uncharacterized protein n=1 Tax=Microvirga lotononidis TaxID=864069 RepID=I4YQV2_9HYPH|nr:hypothetical protein MicloDRAFT_00028930 [Microvirga lotononidis]
MGTDEPGQGQDPLQLEAAGAVELFLSYPPVTVPRAAKLLKVMPDAVNLLLALPGACRASSPDPPTTELGNSCKISFLSRILSS